MIQSEYVQGPEWNVPIFSVLALEMAEKKGRIETSNGATSCAWLLARSLCQALSTTSGTTPKRALERNATYPFLTSNSPSL